MHDKKMFLMPLMLMLALGISGVAFSHWSDKVYITGEVNMGTLALAFDYVEPPTADEYYWNLTHTAKIKGEYLDKEVGSCDAWYENYVQDPHTLKEGYKVLKIVVNNAYPQYIVHTTFKLHNIGTVSLNVENYIITGEKRDNENNVENNLLWYDPDNDYIGSLWEDVNGNGVVDIMGPDLEVINLEITDHLPYTIDPCNTDKAEIDMEFKQDAQECHTYTIHVTVVAETLS